jgi:ethanolamine utilization protein EutQ (cupin superfamily)
VTVLEGSVVIGATEGETTFGTGETFYIKKGAEISMKTNLKTKVINVCYQTP